MTFEWQTDKQRRRQHGLMVKMKKATCLESWVSNVRCGKENMREQERLPKLEVEGEEESGEIVKKSSTGVGSDGFHPRVLLDLTRGTCQKIVNLLMKLEHGGE